MFGQYEDGGWRIADSGKAGCRLSLFSILYPLSSFFCSPSLRPAVNVAAARHWFRRSRHLHQRRRARRPANPRRVHPPHRHQSRNADRYRSEQVRRPVARRLEAEKGSPRADVWWKRVFRTINLADAGVLALYESPSAKDVPPLFKDARRTCSAAAGAGHRRARRPGRAKWSRCRTARSRTSRGRS